VRLLSRFATGFGGSTSWSAKSVNFCISAVERIPSRPIRPSKATMKLLNEWFSLQAEPPASVQGSVPKKPETRSPRQCIPPEVARPRSVCVVIGPFIG
jgi:hypothetical protein